MSNATQGGPSSSLSKDDFWYFDRLPPTARQALANAAFDWSSGFFYNRWNRGAKGFKTGRDIAERIVNADKATIKKLGKVKTGC